VRFKVGQRVTYKRAHTNPTAYKDGGVREPIFCVIASVTIRVDGGEEALVRVREVGGGKGVNVGNVWIREDSFSPLSSNKSEDDFL